MVSSDPDLNLSPSPSPNADPYLYSHPYPHPTPDVNETLTLSLSVSLSLTLSLARYHLSEGGHLSITSMLYADDLSTDPKQILAYVLIGMMSGGGHAHQPYAYPLPYP